MTGHRIELLTSGRSFTEIVGVVVDGQELTVPLDHPIQIEGGRDRPVIVTVPILANSVTFTPPVGTE